MLLDEVSASPSAENFLSNIDVDTEMGWSLLNGLDPKLIKILIVIAVVIILIAIVKKAIKAVLVIGLLIFGLSVLLPATENFQKDNGFNLLENHTIEMTVDGETYDFTDIDNIEYVETIMKNKFQTEVIIHYKDSANNNSDIIIPTFMIGNLTTELDKYGIDVQSR